MFKAPKESQSSLDFPISQTRRLIEKLEHTEELPKSPQRKDKLQTVLEEQAEALYLRKLRSQDRKKRVEEMGEQLQNKRAKMLSKIEQKEKRTEVVLNKNEKLRSQKLKGRNEKFDRVLNFNIQQQSKMIDTNLQKRKEFYSTHTTSQMPSNSANSNKNTPKAHVSEEFREGHLLQSKIEEKLKRAEQKHNEQKRITVQKMKEFQKRGEQARQRVQSQEGDNSVLQKLGNYLSKIEQARNHVKETRTHPDRQRDMSDRFEKLKRNISRIEQERQGRIKDLNEKFEKQYGFRRATANRTVDYKDRQEKNLMRIQIEKQARNDDIIRKHQDVGLQNKAYKKCRSKLFDLMITRGEAQ